MARDSYSPVIRSGAGSQRLTREVLDFYGPRCWLQLPGCTGLATTKDHVIPVDHGGTDALENLRPACLSCNSKRRNLAISGVGGIVVTVFVGPPTAPLAARALELAQPGDIVVDVGRIRDALTVAGTDRAGHLDRVAARAWRTAMDQALRMSARCGVWIVHPIPTAKQVQQYARLRYSVETIDPGRAVSEEAAARAGDPHLTREVGRWYALYPEGVASIERVKAHRPTSAMSKYAAAAGEQKPSRAW